MPQKQGLFTVKDPIIMVGTVLIPEHGPLPLQGLKERLLINLIPINEPAQR